MHLRRSISRKVGTTLVLALGLSICCTADAQAPKAAPKAASKAAPRTAAKGKAEKIPDPEDVTLETKDGYNIRATYYGGTAKKASVPIIMVHGWEGQRGEYSFLAKGLQQLGHSIIVPDLRGHGESTTRRMPNGETKEVDLSSFNRRDVENMVWDLEACKQFLRQRNNDGELNIASLCVIAAEAGCIPAVRWTAMDWAAPRLASVRQGQDVQALVLLSPVQSFKGATMREALTVPAIRRIISVMIVAGKEDRSATSEAKRIFSSIESQRPKVPEDQIAEKKDIFFDQPPTSLKGTKLLGGGLDTPMRIANFIRLRLVNRESEFPWSERRSPLE